MKNEVSAQSDAAFVNPFHIEDIAVFDDDTLDHILARDGFGFNCEDLACAVQDGSQTLVQRIVQHIPEQQRPSFLKAFFEPADLIKITHARQLVLDGLFWEFVYWKTPELYEDLTAGERLHPGIFAALEADLHGKIVLDAGAGSGRATFECLQGGASHVYAVDPSPGLLRILQQKLLTRPDAACCTWQSGRFDALPLADHAVDLSLSCSAFTAVPEQGGEAGLAEMRRVTRSGGKIIIVWPRKQDHRWFEAHGFQYVTQSVQDEMCVSFRTMEIALRCARLFYARNPEVMNYIRTMQYPEIPFSVIGINPPCDYYWMTNE